MLSASGKTLRVPGRNVSHAEFHLANFVIDTKLGSRVLGVEIVMSGRWTPCRICAGTLVGLAQWIRRQAGDQEVTLSIDCGKVRLHRDWNGDPAALVAALSGWSVSGDFAKQIPKVEVS